MIIIGILPLTGIIMIIYSIVRRKTQTSNEAKCPKFQKLKAEGDWFGILCTTQEKRWGHRTLRARIDANAQRNAHYRAYCCGCFEDCESFMKEN